LRYDGRAERPLLTLFVECAAVCSPELPLVEITTPDGVVVDASACRFDRERYRHRVTLPVMPGRYRVSPVADRGGQ